MDHVGFVLCVPAVAAGLVLATSGPAGAQPPITGTDVSTFEESFTDPFFCGGELYE